MYERKPLIAGNWKCHGTTAQAKNLIDNICQSASQFEDTEILVIPPFVHLSLVKDLTQNTPVELGAQNLYLANDGAYTGEISGNMLKDIGCEYVLVGHSERRTIFSENLAIIATKCKAAIEADLIPILCIGETQAERDSGKTESIIKTQLESVIKEIGITGLAKIVIAYEPVWAIGTGLTATPEQAQVVHAYIRQLIKQNNVDIARTIRILYGGSMKPENAAMLLSMPDIDGGLIGGASLKAESFLAICAAANQKLAAQKKVG